MLRQGMSIVEISKKLKIKWITCRKYIGDEFEKTVNEIRVEKFNLIKSYLLKGYKIEDVSKETNMSVNKIKGILAINNYNVDKAKVATALQCRKDGMSDKEIAQKLKISVKYLNHIIAKYQ